VSGIARRFGRLAIQAVEHPDRVDRNALLAAANAMLDMRPAGDPEGMSFAVTMALRALDWCVWDTPKEYARLVRAVQAFGMYSFIKNY
jgi:hypothetical protein